MNDPYFHPLPNVRRAELLSAMVDGDRCDLRLVYRNAPMRVRIDKKTARELIAELTAFVAQGGGG